MESLCDTKGTPIYMYRFAIYGKGGIGKSTTTTALSCAFSALGYRVMQIGCDPKADSTLYLHDGNRIQTILDVLKQKKTNFSLEDLVTIGKHNIICAECGGPTPGLGCAGRGIGASFEALEEASTFEIYQPDIVLYDVLGDVVCGGFALPIRQGYADQVYIVTSGENMSIYAAANIATAVHNFEERGYATIGGVILNSRNVDNESEKVEVLCNDIDSKIVGILPREERISICESNNQLFMDQYPDSEYSKQIMNIAKYMIENGVNHE